MSVSLRQPSAASPTSTLPLLEHLDPLVRKIYLGFYPVPGQTPGDLLLRIANNLAPLIRYKGGVDIDSNRVSVAAFDVYSSLRQKVVVMVHEGLQNTRIIASGQMTGREATINKSLVFEIDILMDGMLESIKATADSMSRPPS